MKPYWMRRPGSCEYGEATEDYCTRDGAWTTMRRGVEVRLCGKHQIEDAKNSGGDAEDYAVVES